MREAKKKENVAVDCGDLYQMLIAECRYGYSRNNHLMPAGAFGHCREYLPKMAKVSVDAACHTANQLADEAISEITGHRADVDGAKDRISFFQKGLDDVPVKLEAKWESGIGRYSVSLAFEAVPGIVFHDDKGNAYASFVESRNGGMVDIDILPFDKDPHVYLVRVFRSMPGKPNWYEAIQAWEGKVSVPKGEKMYITVEEMRSAIDVIEYVKFIDFCVDFVEDQGGGAYGLPYNYGEFEKFIEKHPRPKER